MAQSHADLHPNPLDVVEVEVMKHGEDEGGQRDACSVHVGLVGPRCAGGVVALEEPDDLPEQHRLDDLDDFLIKKMEAVRARAMLWKHHALLKRCGATAQYLHKHVRSDEGVRPPETLDQHLVQLRRAQIFGRLLDLSVPVPVRKGA